MSGSGVGTAATTVVGSGEGELDGVVTVSTVFDASDATGLPEPCAVGAMRSCRVDTFGRGARSVALVRSMSETKRMG